MFLEWYDRSAEFRSDIVQEFASHAVIMSDTMSGPLERPNQRPSNFTIFSVFSISFAKSMHSFSLGSLVLPKILFWNERDR